MNAKTRLRASSLTDLSKARDIAHQAAQLVTAAARANLKPMPDDSHSNLGWEGTERRFISQPLGGPDDDFYVGLSLLPLRLDLAGGGQRLATRELEGLAKDDALAWLDTQLLEHGLQPASKAEIPYELPPTVAAISAFSADDEAGHLDCLADWFDLAATHLEHFAAAHADLNPGPSPVRCWPHHFDIATYVQLEAGEFETAKGIGVGMSPGDESYDQPYFYINPWPHPDPAQLAEPPAPGHWHRQGFVGAIATGEEVLTLDDIGRGLPTFIERAFDIGREQLGV